MSNTIRLTMAQALAKFLTRQKTVIDGKTVPIFGGVFAIRGPDPVLQQVESFVDGTISANDVFRPVSRYFDRITRPEQIINVLNRAMQVLTDPAECGPVTLSLCQDVQAEAFDYPA